MYPAWRNGSRVEGNSYDLQHVHRFAESEVVSLIAQNKRTADIVHGLHQSVATKISALLARTKATGSYMMTGGVAKNEGVRRAIEEKIGEPLILPEEPQICGALGAALIAWEG